MAKFQIDGFTCYSERDFYQTGCDPDSGRNWWEDREFTSTTIEGLLAQVAESLSVKPTSIERNACEEIGRIDIQRIENGEGEPASPEEIERWKREEVALWLVTYTGFVMAPVDLKENEK